jgi:hypothetical protein
MKSTIVLVSLCILGFSGCGKSDSKPPGKLPVGFLDNPKQGETVRGLYVVRGWALDEAGIRDVSVFVDRNLVGLATLGRPRPDLVAHYSSFPSPEAGGFEYQWDSGSVPPGPHELTAQARTNDGAVHDLGTVSITTAR